MYVHSGPVNQPQTTAAAAAEGHVYDTVGDKVGANTGPHTSHNYTMPETVRTTFNPAYGQITPRI